MTKNSRSPEEERALIKACISESDVNSKPGDSFYLINFKWWNRWRDYVNYSEKEPSGSLSPPDSIDNSELVDIQGDLKPLQMEGNNYALLPVGAWSQLVSWYGGGPAIKRLMIGVPFVNGGQIQLKNEVEVYLWEIRAWRTNWPMDKSRSEVKILLSRFASTKKLLHSIATKFNSPPHKSKIYLEEGEAPYLTFKHMMATNSTLDDLKLISGTKILFDSQQPDGKFEGPPPCPPRPKDHMTAEEKKAFASRLMAGASSHQYSSAYMSYMNAGDSGWSFDGPTGSSSGGKEPEPVPPPQVGVVGLVNLGNTCFMNAALQSLSNTVPLSEYFLQSKFTADINTSNPLGMGGQLAKCYAEVIDDLWKGTTSYVAPRDLKNSLAKLAPQFSGYRQHDSQEFLAFLLDGLHEDLNRVKKKPYVQKPDDSTVADEKRLATESWRAHLLRNDSIIVDLFQGQLKSTLVCPVCKKISITFDPFMYLSVPLPAQQKRAFRTNFIPLEGNPVAYDLRLPRSCTILDLKKKLAKKLNGSVLADEIQVCDIASWKVFDYFDDTKSLTSVQPNDTLAAYQLQHAKALQNRTKPLPAPTTNSFGTADIGVRVNGKVPNGDKKTEDSNGKKDKKDKDKQEKDKKEKDKANKKDKENQKEKDKIGTLPSAASSLSPTSSTSSTATTSTTSTTSVSEGVPREAIEIQITLRRMEQSFSYMRPMQMVFGMPMVLSFDCKSSFTAAELTTHVWNRVRPLVDIKNSSGILLTPIEPPFTLATVNSTSSGCSLCDIGTCRGCPISVLAKDKVSTNPINVSSLKDRAVFSADFNTEITVLYKMPPLQAKSNPKPTPVITLADCMNLFLTSEQLGPEDPWYCPKCKVHQQAMKKFDVWTLPHIVVVHLKRFSQDQRTGYREKLDVPVEYPVESWDLGAKSASGQSVLYDLYAVVNHFGGLGGGHYTAYAKNKIDNEWYHFNDSNCSKVQPSEAVSKSAYVLFYVKRK